MAERPLLILPTPTEGELKKEGGGAPRINRPSHSDQERRFAPKFDRLKRLLDDDARGSLELKNDPASLAHERVIVFDVAGSIESFTKSIAKVSGLEFMSEVDVDSDADNYFSVPGSDKLVSGRFYLAMPNVAALQELVRLWERWKNGQPMDRGFTPFRDVFDSLRDLRPWGPEDRIPEDTKAYWEEEKRRAPDQPIRTEVELWYHASPERRAEASATFAEHVEDAGGTIIAEAVISDAAYHGALVDIPMSEVDRLIAQNHVHLAIADEIMFMLPQSVLLSPEQDDDTDADQEASAPALPVNNVPIAALLDGVPLQRHALLDGRMVINDPDGLEDLTPVLARQHGTAMASLIIHGDLNAGDGPIEYPLYVRPIMCAEAGHGEHTPHDRLVADLIHRAIVEMRGTDQQEGAAPHVFIVNLSIGEARRPFAGRISPLARVLDFLSSKYGILFLVSAGNCSEPLVLSEFDTWDEFEQAAAADKTRSVIQALNNVKQSRTILSPAESLNSLTIGAQHCDAIRSRPQAAHSVDPHDSDGWANPSSRLGLGYRRAVKPEILMPGGREQLRMQASGDGVSAGFRGPQRLFGLAAASSDRSGAGNLSKVANSDGTSSATALTTHAAHKIFQALMDDENGSLLADMPSEYYAVVVKALLVHTAHWSDARDVIGEICGPADGRRHQELRENIARFLGFGCPDVSSAVECAQNRATLIGFGELTSKKAHQFRLPLPESLEGTTEARALTATVAWFSPVHHSMQRYRRARLVATPIEPIARFGVERAVNIQPEQPTTKKGTVFHERYEGTYATSFVDDGHLALNVWCKDDAGGFSEPIRYGVAVTVEAEANLPIYEEIANKLRIETEAR